MPASASASVIPQASPVRMPASVVTSLALHGAVFGLLMYTAHQAARHQTVLAENVEFRTVTVKSTTPLPPPKAAARQEAMKSFNFMKLALPSIPHLAAPQMAQIKLPENHKMMQVETPKLKDRGRLDTGPKLDMDVDKAHDNLDIAKVEARIPARKLAAMAAMPRLEDIGRKRVANLPQAMALEEKRQEAVTLKGMGAIAAAANSRHGSMAPVETIQDAAPDRSKFSQKIAAFLPEEQSLDMGHAVMPATVKQAIAAPDEAPKRTATKVLQGTESKKGIEIEGPLADRKVVNYDIPEFPSWAKDQGILDASVAIRFWVNKDGEVLPNMRVEHTSGYGQLDRLAMDSLAKWKFAPLLSEEKQWGVITFKFVLE
jgi:TonB family protein